MPAIHAPCSRPGRLIAAVLTILPALAGGAALAGDFGGFASPLQFDSGNQTEGVAVADLNGDGQPDLASVNDGDGTITTFRGRYDGTFEAIGSFATGAAPRSVALGDLDGDGLPDAVVTSWTEAIVNVHMNDGAGFLAARTTFPIAGPALTVKIADMNGDGFADVVSGNHDTYDISIVRGRGNGTFDPAQHVALDRRPWSIAIADMNGDGRPDVLAATIDSTPPWDGDRLQVLINDGAGGFEPPRQTEVLGSPTGVAAGDFDHDGILDAVTSSNAGYATVVRGVGDGTFSTRTDVFLNGQPSAVVTADLNRDGITDFAVADRYLNRVNSVISDGAGGFAGSVYHAAGINPVGIDAADFDDDGDTDIIVANTSIIGHTVSMLRNETRAVACARLTRFSIVTGHLQFGDLASLGGGSSGDFAFIASAPVTGGGFGKPNGIEQRMEIEVEAAIDAVRVSRLNIEIGSSVHPGPAVGEVFLLNHLTNRFDSAGTFEVTSFGGSVAIERIEADPYVDFDRRPDGANTGGRVILRLRHTRTDDPDLAFTTFLDLVGITYR